MRPADLRVALRGGPPRACLLHGDEPFQLGECQDWVRAAARAAGIEERIVLHAGNDFDWQELAAHTDAMSLFAARRLFEVRLSGRPGAAGAKAFKRHLDAGSEDVLMVVSPGLDWSARKTAWYKSLDGVAALALVEVAPVPPPALPAWLAERFVAHGLRASEEACTLLAARTEGNLMAAAQEVDKLALLASGEQVGVEEVAAGAGDSARFGAFDLVDAAIEGDPARVVRVLEGLRSEGVELLQLLGAVTWSLRNLCAVAGLVAGGETPRSALGRGPFGALRRRAAAVERLIERMGAGALRAELRAAHGIDRCIKGRAPGQPWARLEQLCLALAGASVVQVEDQDP